jgi:hypothetical protein
MRSKRDFVNVWILLMFGIISHKRKVFRLPFIATPLAAVVMWIVWCENVSAVFAVAHYTCPIHPAYIFFVHTISLGYKNPTS